MASDEKYDGLIDQDIDQDDELNQAALRELLRVAHKRLDPVLRRLQRPRAGVGVATTPLGRLLVAQSARGLMALRFPEEDEGAGFLSALRRHFDVVEDGALAAEVSDEIVRLLHGDASAIAHRPVDLSLVASDFQRRALSRLRKVPAGAVTTYQALAGAAGSPAAQRAIGNTVAVNPIAIYVPCHRVIRSDGSIGNYGGGVERKLALLRAEGFAADRTRRIPAEAVYGHLGTRIFCRPSCSAAKRARRDRMFIFAAPDRAAAAGMRACKLCRPS
ncbi:MAG TPA: methylated-DNA--[protein]-cysteine S-methyltransferase [Candidatus Binataceae bacterium]|nr:methylated-DNA--[protein]-cysteine S-methyltransferase [Candidatus Binataceae bacterium]